MWLKTIREKFQECHCLNKYGCQTVRKFFGKSNGKDEWRNEDETVRFTNLIVSILVIIIIVIITYVIKNLSVL